MLNKFVRRAMSLAKISLFFVPILMGVFLYSEIARGAIITWTGDGADNNWSTPDNWSSDTVPVNGDTVIFDGDPDVVNSNTDALIDSGFTPTNIRVIMQSGYTGTVSQEKASQTIQLLVLEGGTYNMNGNTLILRYSPFSPYFNGNVIDGGAFNSGGGTIEAESLVYRSGTLDLTGSLLSLKFGVNGSSLGYNHYGCTSGNFNTITNVARVEADKANGVGREIFITPGCTFTIDDFIANRQTTLRVGSGASLIVEEDTLAGQIILTDATSTFTAGTGEFRADYFTTDKTINNQFDLTEASYIFIGRNLTVASGHELVFAGTDIEFGGNLII